MKPTSSTQLRAGAACPHEFLKAIARALEETARHGFAVEHFVLVPAQVALHLNGQGAGLTAVAEGQRLTVSSPGEEFQLVIDFRQAGAATNRRAERADPSWPPR